MKYTNLSWERNIPEYAKSRTWSLTLLNTLLSRRGFDIKGHSDRVLDTSVAIGRKAGLSPRELSDLRLFAKFHDLGKTFLPEEILFKERELTEDEWKAIRLHSNMGAKIASMISEISHIADYILMHHERWDGRGYPLGISGLEIPLFCRILNIADAWDAMITDRPYRKAMSYTDAAREINANVGLQFDPTLVEIWRKL